MDPEFLELIRHAGGAVQVVPLLAWVKMVEACAWLIGLTLIFWQLSRAACCVLHFPII